MIRNEVVRISIGSVTYAMKAQRALAVAAIYSEVIKTEAARPGRGCTYGLEFSRDQLDGVRFVLKNAGIKFKEMTKV